VSVPGGRTAARSARRAAAIAAALVLAACSVAPTPQPVRALDPALWFAPHSSQVLWDLYADVCDAAARAGSPVEQPTWVRERARLDLDALALLAANQTYVLEHAVAGIARLDLVANEDLAWVPALDEDPLGRRVGPLWRLHLERWLAEQPDESRAERLADAFVAHWREAVARRDVDHLARLVEAADAHGLADLLPEGGRTEIAAVLRGLRPDEQVAAAAPAVAVLLERRGVPADLDLEAWRRATRARFAELYDATIPLPHPFDLELALARFEKLARP